MAAARDAAITGASALTSDSAFSRLWLGFMTARLGIAVVLVLLMGALYTLAPGLNVSRWLVGLCFAYLGAALTVRIFSRPLPPGRAFDPQWVSTIGVDLLAFSVLQFLQPANINFSPLFALPVLMGAVLGSALLALGTAAGVAFILLADAGVAALPLQADAAGPFLQAGLTGIGFFALAFLVNQLAARLAREELAAQHGRLAARMQAQVNELVIEGLAEGVLVVDAAWRVHAANPAARALLGFEAPVARHAFSLASHTPWSPLVSLAGRTLRDGDGQIGEVTLEDGGARRIHVRTRLTHTEDPQAERLCVMFLQDLREMEARLRTEKLAAMGRMSAAVAHEIRNPLAAIAQANDLMDEDLQDPGLRQLSDLVRKNAQRLGRIVDEILDVTRVQPGAIPAGSGLDLDAAVEAACADWAAQARGGPRLQVATAARRARVRFETDHLRRVLVNLLDNARRHAGELPDSIRVTTHSIAGVASLRVWSDGAPLEASVETHLFEPFFSSESRSSGLGLFICRELCERHGAVIGYERTAGGAPGATREGNAFMVTFAPAAPLAGAAPYDTIPA